MLVRTIIACLALSAPAARACTPPDFPVPDDVKRIEFKKADGESPTAADNFLMQSYEKDKDRYLELYEQLYPCGLYGDSVTVTGLPPEEQEMMRQELVLLERKWGQQGATEQNRATAEQFTDVPDGEFIAVE